MATKTTTTTAKSRVQSASKALRVLEILADCPHSEMGVSELARRLGWHRTTAYRFMQTLVDEGYVRYVPASDSYRLSFKIVGLANQMVNQLDIRQVVRPHLIRLVDQTQIDGHLGVLEEDHIVFVDRIDCQKPLRTAFHIGRWAPAHATAIGKALLAELDWEVVRQRVCGGGLEGFTPNTLNTAEKLRADLECVRLRGYATDQEEHNQGVGCVAAAVLDITGRAVAGISLSGSAQEVVPQASTLGPAVRRTADAISAELGWHGPTRP